MGDHWTNETKIIIETRLDQLQLTPYSLLLKVDDFTTLLPVLSRLRKGRTPLTDNQVNTDSLTSTSKDYSGPL